MVYKLVESWQRCAPDLAIILHGTISMMRYAEMYPDRFSFAATLFGSLDLLDGPVGAALLPWAQQGWKAQNPIT
jgi:enterochelin esterase-like enzyme